MTTDAAIDRQAFVEALGLTYDAAFVPQSLSRNATEKHPTINWRVTLKRGDKLVSTDYTQGIAHMPGYTQGRRTLEVAEREQMAAEKGRYCKGNQTWNSQPLPAPKLLDVLYTLVLDSDVLSYACYEDWAGDFGYDADSRAGEAIYHACRAIAIPFSRMFTGQELDGLRTIFQDY